MFPILDVPSLVDPIYTKKQHIDVEMSVENSSQKSSTHSQNSFSSLQSSSSSDEEDSQIHMFETTLDNTWSNSNDLQQQEIPCDVCVACTVLQI